MTTLAELRTKIDDVDQRIIALLSERAGYVREIGQHKKSDTDIVASDRQQQVYLTRRHA
jgi:chorismate mutase